MFLLVTYDISDDKRRAKIEKELSSYGVRVNFSVFELGISKAELLMLEDRLRTFMKPKEDSVRLYFIDKASLHKSKDLGSRANPYILESGYVS